MLKLMTPCIGSMTLCVALFCLAGPTLAGQQRSVLQQPTDQEIQLNSPANNPLQVQSLKPTTPLSVQGEQDPDRDLDLLTKGPLHEAFAELPQDNPSPNPLVTRQPPEQVKELPPKYQPEGENVEWIPGYWAWDEDRDDYLWISGIWRDLPPGQRWVPGYWNEEEDGFRWVNGFWMDDEVEEIEYLPAPPESLDQGPSTPAPSDSHFYAPGNWVYQDSDYVWQAGCWMPRVDNWIWVQPCYVWTPRGCVFRAGYWDRLFDARGVVFAPVCYRRPIYVGVDYFFTPSCVINTNYDLFPHLFVRRNCRSYYFGDWYDNGYINRGFCAWSRLNVSVGFGRCYDPFFVYYNHASIRYNNLGVVGWARNQYDFCYQNAGFRPPALFNVNINIINQKTIVNGQPAPQPVAIADTLERRVKTTGRRADGRDAFRQLAEDEQRDAQKRSEPIQEIARERRAAERLAAEQRAAERRAERELAKSGGAQPGVGNDPVLRQADRPEEPNAPLADQGRPEKLALPKVDRRQQMAADKAAAELKRQQEKDERTARAEERRAATEAANADRRATRKSGESAGVNPPVLKRTDASSEVAESGRLPSPEEANKPRANRGSKLPDSNQVGGEPGIARNAQPERLTPEQRREATQARQAELKTAQQARENAREVARQQDAAARELERQQRSSSRSNPLPPANVQPQESRSANSVNRELERANRLAAEQQQRQQREFELQQRRGSEQAARQAAEQQRSAEQALRRQQEAQERAMRQQQDLQQRESRRMQDQMRQQQMQQQQQQQQARDAAARQQRDMERQQRDMQRQQQQQQQRQQQQQQQQERQERRRKG